MKSYLGSYISLNPDTNQATYGLRHAKTWLWAYADSEGPDQGLHCPLTKSLDTPECINEEQMPGWYIAHA